MTTAIKTASERERELFEAWRRRTTNMVDKDGSVAREGFGDDADYEHRGTRSMWVGWSARASLPSLPEGQPEAVEDLLLMWSTGSVTVEQFRAKLHQIVAALAAGRAEPVTYTIEPLGVKVHTTVNRQPVAMPADSDAGRYRWLRDKSGFDLRTALGVGDFTKLDAFIDRKMDDGLRLDRLPSDGVRSASADLAAPVAAPSQPVGSALTAFDEAIAAELPRVSTLEYNSHEICKHFAGKVRERLAALTPEPAALPAEVTDEQLKQIVQAHTDAWGDSKAFDLRDMNFARRILALATPIAAQPAEPPVCPFCGGDKGHWEGCRAPNIPAAQPAAAEPVCANCGFNKGEHFGSGNYCTNEGHSRSAWKDSK